MNINIVIYILVFLSAVGVYLDSRKYRKANLIGSSIAWAILTFLFWLPTFPIYLILRFLKYQKQIKNPEYQPNKLIINLGIIFWAIVFIVVLGFYLKEKGILLNLF